MLDHNCRILLVEPDEQALQLLVAALVGRFYPHLTCVSTMEEAIGVEVDDPHDLTIAELELPDGDGIELAGQLNALRRRPIILLADNPSRNDAIEAMRVGINDMFPKPFAVSRLLSAAERALHGYDAHCQHRKRHQRLRNLVRRIVRERRELRLRTELVCKDLVAAQRRLVQRVLDSPECRTADGE